MNKVKQSSSTEHTVVTMVLQKKLQVHNFTIDIQSGEVMLSVSLQANGGVTQNEFVLFLEKRITVEQLFLGKGHNMMECNSVHATLEHYFPPTINSPMYYLPCMQQTRQKNHTVSGI
ncbi:hypothetical protein PR048_012651 [Dryococelus australis]|uniref:Uncharacterized protein n=1 Tax=Dryococelus australis TaxID=614101 RepID=A0ABQ9HPZ9_9NEOP|nr:hypothetical protein PR048_012651 [Dryococelus australis]